MKIDKYLKAFVCIETAVVLGIYLLIIGSMIELGLDLYEKALLEAEDVNELKSVEEWCRLRRIL